MRKNRPFLPVLIALLVFVGSLVLLRPTRVANAASGQNGYPPGTTNIFASGYYPDQQEKQPWRGPLTIADPTNLTAGTLAGFTVANGGRIKSLGRPNIPVSLRFSASGQQAAIAYLAIWVNNGAPSVDHVLGISDITTLTATQFQDPDGRYMSPTWLFSSYGGSDGIVLLVTPPSSGSVYMDPGSF